MASSLLLRPRARTLAALAAAVAAVPAAGCGDSASSAAGNAAADPASSLPASAPVYVEAQVRPAGDLKANVDAVAGKLLHTGDPGGKLVALIDRGLKDDGDSYAKDIEPWLGQRAGLAVTGVGAGGHSADVVAAVASKDDEAAKAFVASRKGATERTYRGVTYRFQARDDLAAAASRRRGRARDRARLQVGGRRAGGQRAELGRRLQEGPGHRRHRRPGLLLRRSRPRVRPRRRRASRGAAGARRPASSSARPRACWPAAACAGSPGGSTSRATRSASTPRSSA